MENGYRTGSWKPIENNFKKRRIMDDIKCYKKTRKLKKLLDLVT